MIEKIYGKLILRDEVNLKYFEKFSKNEAIKYKCIFGHLMSISIDDGSDIVAGCKECDIFHDVTCSFDRLKYLVYSKQTLDKIMTEAQVYCAEEIIKNYFDGKNLGDFTAMLSRLHAKINNRPFPNEW